MSIELSHVTRIYRSSHDVLALDDVCISVADGEWLAVMGPSGSGKSTLVNLIGCLDRPSSGEIRIEGINVEKVTAAELNRFRAEKIGFIFQQFHMVSYLTAVENVMLAQYFHSMTDRDHALEALERVGLRQHADRLPSLLSGGEQQRICIARALINDPDIILADEPTGNLDARNERIVLEQLQELHAQGHTIIMVTHDPEVARLADRRLEIQHGKVIFEQTFLPTSQKELDDLLESLWLRSEDSSWEGALLKASSALNLQLKHLQLMEMIQVIEGMNGDTRRNGDASSTYRVALRQACDSQSAVVLTAKGKKYAEDIVRRHRLAEHLFVQGSGLDNDQPRHPHSCGSRPILSPEVAETICASLGHPRMCPHGNPIPPGSCCSLEDGLISPVISISGINAHQTSGWSPELEQRN